MKLLLIITILLSFLLISCGYKEIHFIRNPNNFNTLRTINVKIDEKFDKYEVYEIEKSINNWNYSLNNLIVLKLSDDKFKMNLEDIKNNNNWYIIKIDKTSDFIPKNTEGFNTVAFVNKIGGNRIYIIDKMVLIDDLLNVTTHEIGHLFGLMHDDINHNSLMYPIYERKTKYCIDNYTINQLSLKLNVDKDVFNYCIFTN